MTDTISVHEADLDRLRTAAAGRGPRLPRLRAPRRLAPAATAAGTHGGAARVAGPLLRGRVRRPGVAAGVRRRWRARRRADHHRPGAGGRGRAGVRQRRRPRRARSLAAALRQRRAAPALHPADPRGRGDLVSGVLGAGRRVGSRIAAHPCRRAWRPLRGQRAEDVGLLGAVRPLVRRAGPDPGCRPEAPRDLDADRRHAIARRRAASDDADHRARGVLRAVPRRRRRTQGEPPRRPRRRLEDRHAHARPRARHGRAPAAGQAAHVAGPRGPRGIRAHRRRRPADRRSRRAARAGPRLGRRGGPAPPRLPDRRRVPQRWCRRPRQLERQAAHGGGRAAAGGDRDRAPRADDRARRARCRRRGRLLERDVSLLARGERVRRYTADPARHHRRPRPRPAEGVAVMDLELSDEQQWLSEAVETLLAREAGGGRLWASLVEFGALSVGGEDGLGAVELCLIARALGAHLAPVPYLGSAAVRFAVEPLAGGEDAVALALLEPGSGWGSATSSTTIDATAARNVLNGRKVAVEHAEAVEQLAVAASGPDGAGLAIVAARAPGVAVTEQPAFDATVPMYAVDL